MAEHRTMSAEAFFAAREPNFTVSPAVLSGRPYLELRMRSGRSLLIPISDAADVAAAIDRGVSEYVASEVAAR